MDNFRVKYEYTSPFGEKWFIQKQYYGFLWLKYKSNQCNTHYDETLADIHCKKLIEGTLIEQRLKKINKLLKS